MSAAAATAGVLCMEAMWTLFLPRFDVVRQVLAQGVLGDVRTVLADHGERFDPPTGSLTLHWRAGPCSTSAAT